MPFFSPPVLYLSAIIAGWLDRHHAHVVGYLREENRVLREQLGCRRIRFADDQRRRLARKGKVLGRKLLGEVATLVTPDTILRWHRKLVALKWTQRPRRVGRPRVLPETEGLVVRMAQENPRWGYERIRGALLNLGRVLAKNTVKNILLRNGIDPSPDRKGSWTTFLRAHLGTSAAMDFFTTEVWTKSGLTTFYTLVVLDLETRRLRIAGTTPNPGGDFIQNMGLELTNPIDGFLLGKTHVIHDRDGIFSPEFDDILRREGMKPVRTPARMPDCNAHVERAILSIKSECVDRMIFFGEGHFRRALREYEAHYNSERPHQGIDNRIPEGGDLPGEAVPVGVIECQERLGGLLKSYRRAA